MSGPGHQEITAVTRTDKTCQRLMTVPGIGPSRTSFDAVGDGETFARGRDFAAWLGLVPKQISTGDRTILGRLSKRGNTCRKLADVLRLKADIGALLALAAGDQSLRFRPHYGDS